jgi:hypothetical protein
MSDERFYSWNKHTQYIPSLEEVKSFFIKQGVIEERHAIEWFEQREKSNWCSASGKKIMNWSQYAKFKTDDINKFNEKKPKLSNLEIIASGFLDLHRVKNPMSDGNIYIKNLILVLEQVKTKMGFQNNLEDDVKFLHYLQEIDMQGDFSVKNINETINN